MEKYNLNEGNESLKRILLMMKYDNKKTLSENVEEINEQGVGSVLKNVATGAATGAAVGSVGAGIGAIPGAVVGGLIGLTATFIGTQNFDSTKKLFEGCKSDTSKTTLSVDELDNLSDALNDAIDGVGTDEEAIKSVFKSIPSIPDLCGLIKNYGEYHGDLFSDLDGDLDGDNEWKDNVWLPLRGAMRFTQNAQKQVKSTTDNKKTSGSKYKQCSGTYKLYCYNKNVIGQVQGCLGLKQDGYFGPKTQAALKGVGFENGFTDADVTKICQKNDNNVRPEVSTASTLQAKGIQPVQTPLSQINADSVIDPRFNT